jgi:hypothetical protein
MHIVNIVEIVTSDTPSINPIINTNPVSSH